MPDHILDNVRRGKVGVTPLSEKVVLSVNEWRARIEEWRGTKLPRLAEIDVLEYVEYLEAQLDAPRPERTSDVAGLMREAAEIMREFEANVSDPHDRVCACCAIAGRGTRAHAPDCPVTHFRDWLRKVGLDGEQ